MLLVVDGANTAYNRRWNLRRKKEILVEILTILQRNLKFFAL